MIGGCARVVQDVPPYVMVDGHSGLIVGLNLVGLRRNGYGADDVAQLKAAYRLIYRSGLRWVEMLEQLEAQVHQRTGGRLPSRSSRKARAASCKNAACRPVPRSNCAVPRTTTTRSAGSAKPANATPSERSR